MSAVLRINSKDEDDLLEFVGVDNAGGCIYNYEGKPFNGFIDDYNDDGILVYEAEYTDGHLGGLQREYYDNGNIKAEWYVYFGRFDKEQKEWDENGKLITHYKWDDGRCVERLIMTDEARKNWGD